MNSRQKTLEKGSFCFLSDEIRKLELLGVKMTIEAYAWKNLVNEQHTYVMQLSTGSIKEAKEVTNLLKDWKQTGTGTNKDGTEILIFKKEFKDTLDWIEWAKNSPFIIKEEQKDGSQKRLKTTVVIADDGKRTCGLCNKPGHNKATCSLNPKNANRVESGRVDGKNKCKVCGEYGHNARRHATNDK